MVIESSQMQRGKAILLWHINQVRTLCQNLFHSTAKKVSVSLYHTGLLFLRLWTRCACQYISSKSNLFWPILVLYGHCRRCLSAIGNVIFNPKDPIIHLVITRSALFSYSLIWFYTLSFCLHFSLLHCNTLPPFLHVTRILVPLLVSLISSLYFSSYFLHNLFSLNSVHTGVERSFLPNKLNQFWLYCWRRPHICRMWTDGSEQLL